MPRSFRTTLAGLAVVAILATGSWFLSPAEAGKVKVWHYQSPSQYDKSQFKQAVLSSEGTLRLSLRLKPLAALDVSHIWDVVEDKDGNLFVATGSEGKVYKVAPDGKTSVVYEGKESQVFCLAVAPDGAIYAGTGPNGLLVRIAADGNSKVLYYSPESYIWSLAFDAKGETIYAGTGPKGLIYKITRDGKGSVFYTTKQEHVLCVAHGPDGTLYAGTDKNGLIYRIDSKGKGFVLYQAPQSEVRTLLVTQDGLYAGTSSPVRRRASTASSSGGDRPSGGPAVLPGTGRTPQGTSSEESDKGIGSIKDSKDKENEKGIPASAPSQPSSGENSLYRISADGTVREVFREKAMILSLMRAGGHLFIGTGMEGRLYELNEATKERSEIARLDHGQIQSLCRRRDGSIVVGTGDPGKLYILQERYADSGTVTSDVLDAKMISKWGALRWKAQTPAGTKVSIAARSGNVSEPDETWSDWSAEQRDPENAVIPSPTARFLQYRVTLATENSAVTPTVGSITLRYMTTNQAPEVTSIDVPDLDAVNLENPKRLKIKWNATDPNEDELTYSLYIRKDGWKSWVMLEDNLGKNEYEWDTTTTPAGTYQVKVVASDRRDNPDGEALTGERTSGSVIVAHEPPKVTVKVTGVEGDQAIVEATATDPLVRLTSASFAVNGKKWINVFPTDGIFDSKTETFKFKTEPLRPGTHVLVLKVRDAAGNIGSGDVVFTVQGRARD